MHDTGFGPVKAGQYLSFYIGDSRRPLTVTANGTTRSSAMCSTEFQCAWCWLLRAFVPCSYNLELLPGDLSTLKGGSLRVEVVNHGVVSSACPHLSTDSVVYVKYELTADRWQSTPSPTMKPTPSPTKEDTTVVNGLELNINKLDVWKLLQIAIGASVISAFVGVYLCKLRERGWCRGLSARHAIRGSKSWRIGVRTHFLNILN